MSRSLEGESLTFSKISSFLCAIGNFQASSHFMEKSKQLRRSLLSFLELWRVQIMSIGLSKTICTCVGKCSASQ